MTRFAIEPLYGSDWAAALASIAVITCVLLVTPLTKEPHQRRWLIGLRVFAGLVLLLTAIRPTWIRTDNRPASASLVIAVDRSKSMTLPDGESGDRWATQRSVIDALGRGLTGLDNELSIRLMAYAGDAEVIQEWESAERFSELSDALAALAPDGDATELGLALQSAIDSAGGNPLAGVVLIGDGTQTADTKATDGDDATVAARRGAEVLDALGVPLWTVPTGPPGTDGSTRDVAISNLPDSYQLFAGNQFDLGFTVEANGLSSRQVPVSATWIDMMGNETVARTRQVDPQNARETIAVSIPMTAPAPGLYRLRVEADQQDGEWVVSNNSQTSFVEVREGGGRILILEGPGRPEQTYLRRSLSRFPDLEIDYAPIRGDANWPINLEPILRPGRYDIFVLGDLDASAIGKSQLEQLAERVGSGAGLITLGGYHTYGVGGYGDGPLASVLPVKMDRSRRRQPTRSVLTAAELAARESTQLEGPLRVIPSSQHVIVNLGGEDPLQSWADLPPMPGANKFVGPRVAPGVQVLLESEKNDPLMVIGEYGSGRVASLAIDETYRWYRAGKADSHRRFWRQLMLWLMSREESSGDSIVAELDARRFESDANPEFRARLQVIGESRSPITLRAYLRDANDNSTDLKATIASDGMNLSGSLPDLEPGFYELVVTADAPSITDDEVAFQVTETSRELARPMADPVYLKQLADLTTKHGGAAFDAAETEELVAAILAKRRSAETPVVEKFRLGEGPISGWIIFTLFAASLSADWYLRRRWGMA